MFVLVAQSASGNPLGDVGAAAQVVLQGPAALVFGSKAGRDDRLGQSRESVPFRLGRLRLLVTGRDGRDSIPLDEAFQRAGAIQAPRDLPAVHADPGRVVVTMDTQALCQVQGLAARLDRKSTRLNSSHQLIS